MNKLPAYRQAINGRTFSQPWNPASMDPIRRYRSHGRLASMLLAVAIGISLALVIVAWIDWSLT